MDAREIENQAQAYEADVRRRAAMFRSQVQESARARMALQWAAAHAELPPWAPASMQAAEHEEEAGQTEEKVSDRDGESGASSAADAAGQEQRVRVPTGGLFALPGSKAYEVEDVEGTGGAVQCMRADPVPPSFVLACHVTLAGQVEEVVSDLLEQLDRDMGG